MQLVVDRSEISVCVGFTMTRLLCRATCCPLLTVGNQFSCRFHHDASVGQGHMLPVVDGSEISFRLGFTMTRLLGRATCSLSLKRRKLVFVKVSP